MQNRHKLVIHITYRCNFDCDNCCNLIHQARSNEDMSLETLQRFLQESIDLKYPWQEFLLQGGEPILHPDFENICNLFEQYKQKYNPSIVLSIVTNGYGEKAKQLLTYARNRSFRILDSGKSKPILEKTYVYDYMPINVAPLDLDAILTTVGCQWNIGCGIAYNNNGFWECQVAASACRVFDFFKPVCKQLKDLTDERLMSSMEEHCKYCGAALPSIPKVQKQTTSKTWQKYLDIYNKKKSNE